MLYVLATIWITVALFAVWALVLPLFWSRRSVVFSNLDDAKSSGQFDHDGYLYGMSPYDIACDMVTYADNCVTYRPQTLVPFVREWLRENGLVK